jgi:uncharacterized protein (TIGR02058 family)
LQIGIYCIRTEKRVVRILRKFLVEFGMGTDFHGQDVNKAAKKAVKDAVSRSCLCGLQELLDIPEEEFGARVLIRATVAVSRPEEVDTADVASVFPVGAAQVTAVRGGLTVDGLCIPRFGDTDRSIEAALAAVEVFVRD